MKKICRGCGEEFIGHGLRKTCSACRSMEQTTNVQWDRKHHDSFCVHQRRVMEGCSSCKEMFNHMGRLEGTVKSLKDKLNKLKKAMRICLKG